MATDTLDERVTGQEAVLKWGQKEIPITNVSWTRDANTSEVQHNDDLEAKILITGLRYSGSFEYSGRNWDLMNELVSQTETASVSKNEPIRGTLSVTETQVEGDENATYIYTFRGVVVTSQSRDVPADDAASTTWDFSAESMHVSEV